jgi:hypothetical protein
MRTTVATRISVDPGALRALSASTKSVLEKLQIAPAEMAKSDALGRLNDHMQSLTSAVDAIRDPRFLDYMPPQASSIRELNYISDRLTNIIEIPQFPHGLFGDNVRGEIKPLGIGDLKVVKQ